MSNPKDWELRIRNGEIDVKIASLFIRTPFPGIRRVIRTVDGLDRPQLRNPDNKIMARGKKGIREYLNLVHQSQSC